MKTWGSGNMANFKNNKKDILNSGNEGRRCAVVQFAKLVTSGDQEEDFEEHSLSFPLLYFFFFSSSSFFSVIVVKNYNNNNNNNNNNMATG